MLLEGKVALVTGASRGIGKGIALEIARAGASVAVHYLDSEAGARAVANEITAAGGAAEIFQADVASREQAVALVERVAERFGGLDILVNNAGADPRRAFADVDEEFWDRVIDTNLKGAFFCSQAAARIMIARGGGRIVNISSVHAHASMPDLSVYAASKGGLEAMTRQLALELAPHAITVNAVAPGCVRVEKNTFDPAERGREIPLGRVGTPGDVAGLAGYLVSPAAEWVTGQSITVDGGTTARLFLRVAEWNEANCPR